MRFTEIARTHCNMRAGHCSGETSRTDHLQGW